MTGGGLDRSGGAWLAHRLTRMERNAMFLFASLLVLVVGCYLPGEDVRRSVASQVQVSVLRCRAELVAGEISNLSDSDVDVTITPRWLDNQSNVLHETTLDPISVPANSTVEWQADAAEDDVEAPAICQAETVSVQETG